MNNNQKNSKITLLTELLVAAQIHAQYYVKFIAKKKVIY